MSLNNASLAQIGTFFNNVDGAILHNISKDLRSQGRLELQMRATRMRKLQNLQWGTILDNPKLRYVYGERGAGAIVGKSFREKEQFLNSIGLETVELTSVEVSMVEKAQATVGKHITPMSVEERVRIYSKLVNPNNNISDLYIAMKQFNFADMLETWSLDENRRFHHKSFLDISDYFYLKLKDMSVTNNLKRKDDSKMCILFSMMVADLCKTDDNFGFDFLFIHQSVKSAALRVYVATRVACGDDFLKTYNNEDTLLRHFLDSERIDYKCLSIIAPHLTDITNLHSKTLARGGSFHIIPSLIQGHGMLTNNFTYFIRASGRCKNRNMYLSGIWKKFTAISMFVIDLIKIHNFTAENLIDEMKKYVKDPNVKPTSSMRDSLWKRAYYASLQLSNCTIEEAMLMDLSKYYAGDITGNDYDPFLDYIEVDIPPIPDNFIQI